MRIWVVEWMGEKGWRLEEAFEKQKDAKKCLAWCKSVEDEIKFRVRAYERAEGSK